MEDLIMNFYKQNLEQLDDAWYKHCFVNTKIPKIQDRIKAYHSENGFWSFVESQYNQKLAA